jgi:hypothetical protein
MAMGLGRKLNPSCVMGFFNGRILYLRPWVWDGKTQRICAYCHLYLQVLKALPLPSFGNYGFGFCEQTDKTM